MNTALKCLVALAVMLEIGARASAQVTKPYSPQCDHDQIALMVGDVAMSLGIDRVVTPTMACLLRLWREEQEGTTRYYESSAFLAIMDQNPQLFFSAMPKEPKIFSEWLKRLPDDSFAWPFDPPCGLETRRMQLISVLQRTEVKGANLRALKNAVINQLSLIRCRQIE